MRARTSIMLSAYIRERVCDLESIFRSIFLTSSSKHTRAGWDVECTHLCTHATREDIEARWGRECFHGVARNASIYSTVRAC